MGLSLKRAIAVASVTAILASCASSGTNLERREVGETVVDKSSTEASFMFESDRLEERIKNSGGLITDPSLNAYIDELTRDITGDYEGELRVYLVEAPVFNAGILPNGAMIVYSGLLLRAENEAELALVLGHEFGHYVERHALESRAAREQASVGMVLFTVGTLGYGGLVAAIAAETGMSRFSKDQEIEADALGLASIKDVGYDPNAAINLWSNLSSEQAASTNKKVRKRSEQSPIFGTHPTSSTRLEKLAELIGEDEGEGVVDKTEYRSMIRPFLKTWLEAELTQRDYGGLLHLIDRLDNEPKDRGLLNYMKGRVYATRNEADDMKTALAYYIHATDYADAPAVVWREIGDIHRDADDTNKAVKAFEQYLDVAPDAEDKNLIEFIINKLETQS